MNNTTDEEVASLIKELEELQLKIGVVTNRLRSVQRDNKTTSETPPHDNTTEDEAQATKPRRSKRQKEVRVNDKKVENKPKKVNNDKARNKSKTYVYKKGDRIRVKNPTRKQRVTIGTVNKHRRNGYVDFTLDDGITTCRAYKNVELICKAEDRNKF